MVKTRMRRRKFITSIAAFAAASSLPTAAISATGVQYAVLDPATRQTVLSQNAHIRRHPASLTKMMTAAVVFDAIRSSKTNFNLESLVEIPRAINLIPNGIATFGSLKNPGKKVPARKLLIGMGTRSDAISTLALAIHLGHKDVYDWGAPDNRSGEIQNLHRTLSLMNNKAERLGMHDSNFEVVTGLPFDDHFSTPHDMAILAHHLSDGEFEKLTEITFGNPHPNLHPISSGRIHSSRLLRSRPDKVQWAKTGWTNAAGYCLTVLYEKNDRPLIGVVMGARNRGHRNAVMLDILTTAYQRIDNTPPVPPLPQQRPEEWH